ncbi:MAG: Unknown protein [uncultured Aureispira sp.]|uniref:Uncharacterized protein n=1 Tax=uncultured Aureispira sp. TaxID=1331704 RepID=A0A6S6TS06_9BACT|nr:MAG: Unknown protein [uncultured Aureispira sp.]
MVKIWATCTNFNLHDLLQYVIICSLALFFAMQPVLQVVLDLAEYDLCETYEDDEAEEKEELKEKQKKETKFYTLKESTSISTANTAAHSITETILFAQLSYVREFYLEIPIPPPELA